MKKVLCLMLALIVLLTGCSSVSVANPSAFGNLNYEGAQGKSIGVVATREGLYCLSYPVWTDNDRKVDYNETLSDLTAYVKKQGCTKISDITATEKKQWIPFLFVFFYNTTTVSAVGSR